MESERPYNQEEDWNFEQTQIERENQLQFDFSNLTGNNNIKEFFNIINSSFNIEDMERICSIIDGKDVDG